MCARARCPPTPTSFLLCPISSAPRPVQSHIPYSGSSELSSSHSLWDVTCPCPQLPLPGMHSPHSPVSKSCLFKVELKCSFFHRTSKSIQIVRPRNSCRKHPTNPSFCGWELGVWGGEGAVWQGMWGTAVLGSNAGSTGHLLTVDLLGKVHSCSISSML